MKIKIVFSFLSAVFFAVGIFLLSMDGNPGEVLGDVTVPGDIQTTVTMTGVTTASASNSSTSSGALTSAGGSESSSGTEAMKISYPVYDRPTGTTDADGREVRSPVGVQQKIVPTDAMQVLQQGQEIRDPDAPIVTLSDRDTDGDGLPDAEEVRIGSNPFNADSDTDGFPDGAEVKKGFNPLKSAASDRGDKVVFESPKEKRISKTAVEDKRLRVEKVERIVREDGQPVTKIAGKGAPNSFLTIYIYSDPIVVTVKTDADGNWSYELDRDLEDGNHEVYAAVTDATGRISVQSSPIPFVKTAQAVSVIPVSDPEHDARGNQSPVDLAGGQFIFFGIALVIMFLLVAFYFIGHRAFSD